MKRFKLNVSNTKSFKLDVNNIKRFSLSVQDSIRGYILEFDNAKYTLSSYLGNQDTYARDLPEFARDLPEFAKQVCGLYVYVKAWASGNVQYRMDSSIDEGVGARCSGDVNYTMSGAMLAMAVVYTIFNGCSYRMNGSMSERIAYKMSCNGNVCRSSTSIIDKLAARCSGSNVARLDGSMTSNKVDVKANCNENHKMNGGITDRLFSGVVYARDLPILAKDLPVNAIDSCFRVRN